MNWNISKIFYVDVMKIENELMGRRVSGDIL